MVHRHKRPTVADIRAMKTRGQKISMLFVTTLDEAAAAAAAKVDMLSIEGRFFSQEMREAAGNCFVQVGLPYGPAGNLATAEDYLRAAYRFGATIARRRSIFRKRFATTPCRSLRMSV
jgi:3-methyl-2-oxobutanoate hydroxymethyltransferase